MHTNTTSSAPAATASVNTIKRGEYVRKLGKSKVYVRGEYCRSTKRYELQDSEDINRVVYVKAGTMLEVGFTY